MEADFAQMQKGKWIMSELINRQMAIDALRNTKFRNDLFLDFGYENAINIIESLPSVQSEPSEITDEQAILHLQSTGWMQNHDREIYESGLKEQLADDSESYDSLIPYEDDEDTISRQAAIDAMKDALDPHIVQFVKSKMAIEALPSAQPERVCVANVTLTDEQVKEVVEKAKNAVISVIELEPHWIPCSERLPEENGQYLITIKYKHVNDSYEDVYAEHGEWLDGKWDMFCFGHCGEVEDIIAWLSLPEPYKG